MEEFRFHLTLTRRLSPAERSRVEPALAALVAPLLAIPTTVRSIAVFVENTPGGNFSVRARAPFGGM